jgi:hypothetical protein
MTQQSQGTEAAGRWPKFERIQWLFPAAVTLHNGEEALMMPRWLHVHAAQLPVVPSAVAIRGALLAVTLMAFLVTALSAKAGRQSFWGYLLFGGAATMLLNVLVPHVPATLLFRGYTPGVVTAVLLNLPVMSLCMAVAVRQQWVTGIRAVRYAVLVPVATVAVIAAYLALAAHLAES